MLHVELRGATNLPGLDRGQTSDPYCVLSLPGVEPVKSKVQLKTTSPVWFESFMIDLKSHDLVCFGCEQSFDDGFGRIKC